MRDLCFNKMKLSKLSLTYGTKYSKERFCSLQPNSFVSVLVWAWLAKQRHKLSCQKPTPAKPFTEKNE